MILLLLSVVVFLFALVVFFGAPYLPTKKRQTQLALEMLGVGKGKTVLDLGSGDGTFLVAAAKTGAVVYGYELNPILYVISWLRCFRYRKQVHLRCTNFWRVQFPAESTDVYVFLITRFMRRLDQKMEAEASRLQRPLKLASFTFAIPGKQAAEAKEAVFLYEYSPKKR